MRPRAHISFHHTHAYPGCPATVIDDGETPAPVGEAVAEFSDGSIAPVSYERIGSDEIIVRVGAYTTARRTRIRAKAWRLRRGRPGEAWKVAAKVNG